MQEKRLKTWKGRSSFSYIGSVKQGTAITYGEGRRLRVICKHEYEALLDRFRGRAVNIGTSRTNRPPGSVGEWLQTNVTPVAMASYVGSILINEGFAEKVGGPGIHFLSRRRRTRPTESDMIQRGFREL